MATFLYALGNIVAWLHMPLFFAAVIAASWITGRSIMNNCKLAPREYAAFGFVFMTPGTWLTFTGCIITWLEDWLKHFAKPDTNIWETSSMYQSFSWSRERWWVQYGLGPLIITFALAVWVYAVVLYSRSKQKQHQ